MGFYFVEEIDRASCVLCRSAQRRGRASSRTTSECLKRACRDERRGRRWPDLNAFLSSSFGYPSLASTTEIMIDLRRKHFVERKHPRKQMRVQGSQNRKNWQESARVGRLLLSLNVDSPFPLLPFPSPCRSRMRTTFYSVQGVGIFREWSEVEEALKVSFDLLSFFPKKEGGLALSCCRAAWSPSFAGKSVQS